MGMRANTNTLEQRSMKLSGHVCKTMTLDASCNLRCSRWSRGHIKDDTG